MTPFLWAVKCKNLELIELYVMKGAEVTGEDVNGDNSLIHAIKSTSWDEESVIEYQKTYEKHFDINYKNKVFSSSLFLGLSSLCHTDLSKCRNFRRETRRFTSP